MSDGSVIEKTQQNPELYALCSAPRETHAEVLADVQEFLAAVEDLRVELEIPEVVCIAMAHNKSADGGSSQACSAITLGDSEATVSLIATLWQLYVVPKLKRLDNLRAMAVGRWDEKKDGVK